MLAAFHKNHCVQGLFSRNTKSHRSSLVPPSRARMYRSRHTYVTARVSDVALRHKVAAATKQRWREALPPGRGGKM